MKLISCSIDLTSITGEKVVVHENGKQYYHFIVEERKEAGQYGDTHMIYEKQTVEEREVRESRVFIGQGKEFTFTDKPKEETKLPPKAAPKKKAVRFGK